MTIMLKGFMSGMKKGFGEIANELVKQTNIPFNEKLSMEVGGLLTPKFERDIYYFRDVTGLEGQAYIIPVFNEDYLISNYRFVYQDVIVFEEPSLTALVANVRAFCQPRNASELANTNAITSKLKNQLGYKDVPVMPTSFKTLAK